MKENFDQLYKTSSPSYCTDQLIQFTNKMLLSPNITDNGFLLSNMQDKNTKRFYTWHYKHQYLHTKKYAPEDTFIPCAHIVLVQNLIHIW